MKASGTSPGTSGTEYTTLRTADRVSWLISKAKAGGLRIQPTTGALSPLSRYY